MVELGTGAMSRESGLSLKALRLYEANGLLVPASVDRVTGYRRYGDAELARARSIDTLRRAGMPLPLVRELLDAPPDRLRAGLADWWASERSAFADRSRLVDGVADRATGDPLDAERIDAIAPRVRTVSRPAQKVAAITRVVEQREIVPTSLADVISIRRHLDDHGARPLAGHALVFHDPVGFELPGRVEAAVAYEGTCDPIGDLVLRIEPAASFAAVDVTASELEYPSLLRFYRAIEREAERHGGATGPPRELYERPWSEAMGDLVATIATPIPTGGRFGSPRASAGLDSAPGADPRISP